MATQKNELRERLARHARLAANADAKVLDDNVAPEFHRRFGPHYSLSQAQLEDWFSSGTLVMVRNAAIDRPEFPEFSREKFVVGYALGGRAHPGNVAIPEIALAASGDDAARQLYGNFAFANLCDVEFLSRFAFEITLRRGYVVRAYPLEN